jgi:hypothetical protein
MESTSASHNMLRTSLALGRPTRQSSNCGRTHQGARLATEMLPRDLGVHTALGDEKPWWEVDLEALNDISRIIGLDRVGYLERGGSLVISVWTDDAQGDLPRASRPLERIIDVAIQNRPVRSREPGRRRAAALSPCHHALTASAARRSRPRFAER